MTPEELLRVWERFTVNKDFMLNPDNEHVRMLVEGVLQNEKKYGLKLCPCRIRDGTKERDLKLLCPCNFRIQHTWAEKGHCWCGLFVRR